jgi:hypothetical protein
VNCKESLNILLTIQDNRGNKWKSPEYTKGNILILGGGRGNGKESVTFSRGCG